ncbi:MAG TPA: hypothetical protein VM616_00420 [Gammaproteobacteria bacterium]|nr:hypothetical protein [Gammaproteobacteria bacterium]
MKYLTPQAKAEELREWETKRSNALPAAGRGGEGFADIEIVPLCDFLNAIPGVCTLQSCAGHDAQNGGLWLWLDQAASEAFDRWGHVLARLPGIETVSREYTAWGQEVTVIDFDNRRDLWTVSIRVFFAALYPVVQSPRFSLERHSLSSSPLDGRLPAGTVVAV